MGIMKYLDQLEGNSKRYVLLIIAPKEKYPIQIIDDLFYKLENSILEKPKSYISIYGEDPNEMMQYVAFRQYLSPVICDKYSLSNRSKTKLKRLNEKEIISFLVAKRFYDTVPYGEKTEEEAIREGKTNAEGFLVKYPLSQFEHASVSR